MHSLTMTRKFTAQHFLVGGDWGPENEWHSHHYQVDFCLTGQNLDKHDFLLDIVDLTQQLEEMVATYKDRTLNDLEPFASRNPSIELFARVLHEDLAARLSGVDTLERLEVVVWEDDIARAGYTAAL